MSAYDVGEREVDQSASSVALQRCTVERDELMPCVYPQGPLLRDWLRGSWRGRRQNPSGGSNQRGQTLLQVPSLPSRSTDRKTQTRGSLCGFTASPVQLQLNQFDPSRGRSSPAWLATPEYAQLPRDEKRPNLLHISKVWHNNFLRRSPSNSEVSPAGRRDELRRPPDYLVAAN